MNGTGISREAMEKAKTMFLTKAPAVIPSNDNGTRLDVAAYLTHYGIEIVKTIQHGTSTLYGLKACVFDESHANNDAAIGQDEQGKLFYQCFHDSCKGDPARHWRDAKQRISGTDSLAPFITGGAINWADRRNGSRQAEDETIPGSLSSDDILQALEANEDGDARLFVTLHRDRFVYDHSAARWYLWNTHYWQEDLVDEVTRGVDTVIEIYGQEVKRQAWERLKCEKSGRTEEAENHEKSVEALYKRIRLLQTVARRMNVLTLARAGHDRLSITGLEWDRDPWLLPCLNGVIDLHTGELKAGCPGDLIKTVVPTLWQGFDTPAPTWEKFLDMVLDERDDLIEFVQRSLGYSITGLATLHTLLILWGIGRNGKGTLVEVLNHVLGPLAGPVESEMILAQRGQRQSGGPTSDIMALRGKRLVWASETSEGRRLNPGKLKWLTGGDSLTGREVFGRRQVSFQPTHKLLLLTNNKPHAPASDYALWQRLHLIPFTLSFVDEPHADHERLADPDLPSRLKAEAPGILAWLVRGCLAWQREGLRPPETVKAATQEYREEEDVIAQFIAEVCVTTPLVYAAMKPLYAAYVKWAEENGMRAENLMRLSRELIERGFQRDDTGRTVFFRGIGIRSESND